MAPETIPDLSDDDVREMARRNHRPHEWWDLDGGLLRVDCDECHQLWPCPTAEALRSRDREPLA